MHQLKLTILLSILLLFLSSCSLFQSQQESMTDDNKVASKYLNIDGLNIHYWDNGNNAPALVFVHGNSSSSQVFKDQLDSPLFKSYRVIALDLPGHGSSQGFKELNSYSMPGYANLLNKLLSELQVIDPVLVGWSLGGHIVLEAVPLVDNLKAVVITGTPPLAFPPAMDKAFLPNPAGQAGFMGALNSEQAANYARAFFAPDASIELTPFINDVMTTDPNARMGLAASIKPNSYVDEVKLVAEISIPIAVIHGELEQLVSLDYIQSLAIAKLWRSQVQIVKNTGHAPHVEASGQFNKLISEFMTDLDNNN